MKPPNIIYIIADDLGYGDLRCYNPNSKIPTPHMDQLAREGLRLTDYHTSSAVCTPTRYSVLTGRYNWRSRLKSGVLTGESPLIIEEGPPTCAELLRQAGYRTACIGKWHLGLDWQTKNGATLDDPLYDWTLKRLDLIDFQKPIRRGVNDVGFDESFIIPSSLDIPPYVYVENDKCLGIPSEKSNCDVDTPYPMREGLAVPGFKAEDVFPEFTRRAVETIRGHANSAAPFFLYFPVPAPHTPIVPERSLRGKTPIGLYGDWVFQMDQAVGSIMAALEAIGQSAQTMIIVTSDHGASPVCGFEELAALGHQPNYPWRGGKADLYEGGNRVPFIVKWPERIPPGTVCPQLACSTDFLATVADIAGISVPARCGQDSATLLPLLECPSSDRAPHDFVIHHSFHGRFAIRRGSWKLIECPGSGGWSFPGDADEICARLPPRQLYNLEKDPGERMNLIEAFPEVASHLQSLLDEARAGERTCPDQGHGSAHL